MIQNTLQVALIQSNIIWEDKQANITHLNQLLSPLATNVDLLILPEMFSTGFTMNTEHLAENMEGSTMEWMLDKAQFFQAVVTGSIIVHEKRKYYNRLIWMHPDGSYQYYDKRHLFSMADEHKFFTPGKSKLIVHLSGWKICPMICYDIRFPVWTRNLSPYYDLLLFVANFPQRRIEAWNSLLPARAIENQAFVLGVNRVGMDGNEIYYSGESGIYDPLGRCLDYRKDEEAILLVDLDYQQLIDTRSEMNFLEDQDEFKMRK